MFIKIKWMEFRIREDFFMYMCDALRKLVPFEQFKKREKHSWRSATLNKVAGFGQVAQSVSNT